MSDLYKLILFISGINIFMLMGLAWFIQLWPAVVWIATAFWAMVAGFAYSRGYR